MVEDFAVEISDVDLVDGGEAITIFGMAEERRRGKEKACSSTRPRSRSGFGRNGRTEEADSSCLRLSSFGVARRNDTQKAGSPPALRPVRNDIAEVSGFGRNDRVDKDAAEARVELELSPKELGEIAEAEFLRTVLRKKIAVSKPWGENRGYDFILDDEGRLNRVQVKAAFRGEQERGYSLRTYRSSKRCYTAKDIDVLAGYVDPGRVWYLFPVRVIKKLRSLKLFPGSKNKRSKHEKWREAWWVVKR
jgi:PD-(D/E)XK endonuclease